VRSRRLDATLFLASLALTAGCSKDDVKGDRPPPPPPPSSAASQSDACASGGGQDTDAISAPFVPRSAGGYCIDAQSEPKTYGDKGKFSMDEVCTTAFDGECEVYKRFDLERVVVLRYVDGTGAPNSVEVNLSRFKTQDGAYAMFTKRTRRSGRSRSAPPGRRAAATRTSGGGSTSPSSPS
jgi:hypothetical protein